MRHGRHRDRRQHHLHRQLAEQSTNERRQAVRDHGVEDEPPRLDDIGDAAGGEGHGLSPPRQAPVPLSGIALDRP
ncbi:hypothetical protein V2J52_05440 [Georgenia sp. MJ173]|uniref:hypothetical protein n=1 Tax=Georgenia sunbinii TaxID=3117728 RepID=UPI002F26CAD3